MNTILSVWCAVCDHLAPFALMAVVPLLLWVHHFETMPADEPALDEAAAPLLVVVDDEPELEAWAA